MDEVEKRDKTVAALKKENQSLKVCCDVCVCMMV